MPSWAVVLISVLVGVALLGAAAWLGWRAWKRYVQRAFFKLMSRREALRAGNQSVAETLAFLAAADEDMLMEFAEHPEELHRRVLHDVCAHAAVVRDELDTMPLPPSLVPAAESLADAAWFLAELTCGIDGAETPDAVLGALGAMNLEPLERALADADADVEAALHAADIDDTVVYGGGLYV